MIIADMITKKLVTKYKYQVEDEDEDLKYVSKNMEELDVRLVIIIQKDSNDFSYGFWTIEDTSRKRKRKLKRILQNEAFEEYSGEVIKIGPFILRNWELNEADEEMSEDSIISMFIDTLHELESMAENELNEETENTILNMEFNIKISEKEHKYFVKNDNVDYEYFLYTVQKRFSRKRIWKKFIVFIIGLTIIGIMFNSKELLLSILNVVIISCLALLPLVIIFDVKSRKIKIGYHISRNYNTRLKKFYDALFSLNDSNKLWLKYAITKHNDGKRHAGASASVRRKEIYVYRYDIFKRMSFNIDIPVIVAGQTVLFLPDAIWLIGDNTIEPFYYNDLEFESSTNNFRESDKDDIPDDSKLIGKTWQYVNADGGPDRRFNDNKLVYIFRYYELEIYVPNGLYLDLLISNYDIGEEFAKKIKSYAESVIPHEDEDEDDDEEVDDEDGDEENESEDEEDN